MRVPNHDQPRSAGPPALLAVAWDNHQGRTQALAEALGGRASFIRGGPHVKALLPVRYLIDAIRTWRLLRARRPATLVVVAPPVLAPLVAWCWCALHGCRLVIDCHTGAFHSWRWRWSVPLLGLFCRRAVVALAHTHEDEALIKGLGANALLLPDEIPDAAQARSRATPDGPRVVVAGSLDGNEPVAEVLAAARLIPHVEMRFTGDPRRVPESARHAASDNVHFTGWLDYPTFLGEMLAAPVVAVFSSDPHIMNRAAFEAIGLGRPLVLTDFAGLRGRFGRAAMFSTNDARMMADTLLRALEQQADLALKSTQLQAELRAQHQEALDRLKTIMEVASSVRFEPAPLTASRSGGGAGS